MAGVYPALRAILYPPDAVSKIGSVLGKVPNLELDTSLSSGLAAVDGHCIILWMEDAAAAISQIKDIRSRDHLASIPLVVVSAEPEPRNYADAADVWLTVPFSTTSLLDKFNKLAALSQRVNALHPVPLSLPQEDKLLIHILRHMYTRQINSLVPISHINSSWGYTYPGISCLSGSSGGEELNHLRRLEKEGLVEGRLHDRIHLCPECSHYQLNFREVCPECRGIDITCKPWLHHFRCSHVAPESAFQRQEHLVCPKCHNKLQAVGVDYDSPRQGFECLSCQAEFHEPQVSCTCLNCGATFDTDRAVRQDILEYCLTQAGIQAAQQGFLGKGALLFHRQTLTGLLLKDTHQRGVTGIMPYKAFEEFMEVQVDIARRFGRPVAFTSLKINNGHSKQPSENEISRILQTNLRCNDVITCPAAGQFLILSTETNYAEVQPALRRIKDVIGRNQLPFGIEVAVIELPNGSGPLDLAGIIKKLEPCHKLL